MAGTKHSLVTLAQGLGLVGLMASLFALSSNSETFLALSTEIGNFGENARDVNGAASRSMMSWSLEEGRHWEIRAITRVKIIDLSDGVQICLQHISNQVKKTWAKDTRRVNQFCGKDAVDVHSAQLHTTETLGWDAYLYDGSQCVDDYHFRSTPVEVDVT